MHSSACKYHFTPTASLKLHQFFILESKEKMKDFEIRCDESRLETTNLIYGKFTLGPFLPGQATTFGNALRRSLLAELSGLAITAFEIIGVMQEFSTLPGLRESILDLSLNLKQIVLTGVLPHSTPPIGFLHVRGPAIIKANDLKLPAGVHCASPNQYIATLGSNGMLHLKFVVSVGKGYSIQPYSIYRSLSKVKLQPSSNFNNTANESAVELRTDYAKQVGYESFKDVNLSSAASTKMNPIPLEGKENNVANKEIARRPGAAEFRVAERRSKDSKGLYVQNKEGLLPQLAQRDRNSENELSPISNNYSFQRSKEGGGQLSFQRGQQLRNSQGITLPPAGETAPTKMNPTGSTQAKSSIYPSGVSKQLEGSDTTLKQRNPVQSSGVVSTNSFRSSFEKTPKESSKAFSSTFLISEKNGAAELRTDSNYINIQTQLFQRISPHQVLPIDAVFTPVSQVNFLTEVNDRFETARENIVLEIWTNGSIHPKRALEEATLSLVQNFDTLLKKIQEASSFYKGLRYWTYLQPFKSSSPTQGYLGEKIAGFSVNSVHPDSASDSLESKGSKSEKDEQLLYPSGVSKHEEPPTEMNPTGYANSREIPFKSPVRAFCERVAGGLERQQEEPLLWQHDQPLLSRQLFQKDLSESIYNLDIGNLNLSLQTFIFLKKAKIHTLLQLLTQFSLRQNNILFRENSHLKSNLLNEKIIEELNDVIKQFGSQD